VLFDASAVVRSLAPGVTSYCLPLGDRRPLPDRLDA